MLGDTARHVRDVNHTSMNNVCDDVRLNYSVGDSV